MLTGVQFYIYILKEECYMNMKFLLAAVDQGETKVNCSCEFSEMEPAVAIQMIKASTEAPDKWKGLVRTISECLVEEQKREFDARMALDRDEFEWRKKKEADEKYWQKRYEDVDKRYDELYKEKQKLQDKVWKLKINGAVDDDDDDEDEESDRD
jgi:hypothetical protein